MPKQIKARESFVDFLKQLQKDRLEIPLTDAEYEEVRAEVLEDLVSARKVRVRDFKPNFTLVSCSIFFSVVLGFLCFSVFHNIFIGKLIAVLFCPITYVAIVWWVETNPFAPKLTVGEKILELEECKRENLVSEQEYQDFHAKILSIGTGDNSVEGNNI